MRVAIFVEQTPEAGGGYQQTLSTVVEVEQALIGHDIVVVTPFAAVADQFAARGIAARTYRNGAAGRFFDSLSALHPRAEQVMRGLRRLGFRRLGRQLDDLLATLGADFAVFNLMSTTPQRLSEHGYAVTVWDLCHRDWPEFPEVAAGREFERRDQVLRTVLPKATAVIANAPSGGDRIARLYGVDRSRIHIVPFLPSLAVRDHAAGRGTVTDDDVRMRYRLPEPFLFYPAQLWPHKNHRYILEAIAILDRDGGPTVDLVLAGGDHGVRRHIERAAAELGVAGRVHYLDFVPDADIPALYQAACALVMPSYFGPTNLPPLEAAALGRPVLYSDLAGFREQMGDAALYCDLDRPATLADHIRTVLTDPGAVERLRKAGLARVAAIDPGIYVRTFQAVLDDFAYLRRLWPDRRDG